MSVCQMFFSVINDPKTTTISKWRLDKNESVGFLMENVF